MRASPRLFVPLGNRAFALLLGGQTASGIGDGLYAVALPWYVLAHRGGPLILATVVACYAVPRTGLILAGGSLADRLSPWRTMLFADAARSVAVGLLAVIAASGPARLGLLIPIAIVLGAGEGIFLPGSSSIVPKLVPPDDIRAANSLNASNNQLASILGPAAGGILLAATGPGVAFAIDAATFVFSAATLALIPTALAPLRAGAGARLRVEAPEGDRSRVPDDPDPVPANVPRSSFSLLRASPVLRVILVILVAANLSYGGVLEVALPALVRGPLAGGSSSYGAIVAMFAIGGLLGTLAAGSIRQSGRLAYVLTAANGTGTVMLILVPFLGGIVGAGAALAVTGFLIMFGNVFAISEFQRWTPPHLLGRIMGLLQFASLGVFPISVLLGGLIVHVLGARAAFPIAGGVSGAALVLALTSRSWREFTADSGFGSSPNVDSAVA